MPRTPCSKAILAAACLLPLLGARPATGGRDEGPVVLIAVDGMAWEVIAPLLEGREYPLIDWAEPLELSRGRRWRPLVGAARDERRRSRGALQLVDSTGPLAGLTTRIELDFPRLDRYRVEGRARAPEPATLTLAARYGFARGRPQPAGNNQTVCRTFEVGRAGADLRLDLQPPTTASKMSLLLLAGEVSCVEPGFVRVGAKGSNPPLEVVELRLVPGKIRGLPRGGFDWGSLPPGGGRLPNLARLVRGGTSGYLRNIEPTLSPVIWTSVVTGETPARHGIEGFLMPAPGGEGKMHVSSSLRRVPALWNILTDYGRRSVGAVSWWASWPAEAVRGFVLTDHANEAAIRLKEDRGYLPREPGLRAVYAEYDTYPGDLLESLGDETAAFAELRRSDLERLLPALDDETWRAVSGISRADRHDPRSLLKFYLQKDLASFRAGRELFAKWSPDLWLIYFNGQDSMQHLFWHYTDPDLFPRADRSGLELYGQLVENYYAMVDGFIGHLAELAGPAANLIVVSDHGVHAVDFMQAGSRTGGHSWRSRGIFVASGPAFRPGHRVQTASIFDIAPTVLGLLGYPVAGELEGSPLVRLLRPEWRRRHPIRRIDRYEFRSPRRAGEARLEAELEDPVSERLRALGYID